MTNVLFCSAGRRCRLLMDFKKTLNGRGLIIATDNSSTAPALYFADKRHIVPRITDPKYLDSILDICKKENIKAITTLIDPEISILANNRERFLDNGIIPLCPNKASADLCFNKYEMFKYLSSKGIRTPLTFHNIDIFKQALAAGEIYFPVFMKPICGSASIGAHRVNDIQTLEEDWNSGQHDYIIQELMTGGDCDADVYVDCISHKAVAAFSKRKIETRIGGASKTISYKDPKLFSFIREICDVFTFNGPLDMDFFIKDGEYYLSEVNPRFGGAYIHAYGAGVDFPQLIINNINGITNKDQIGKYEEDIVMLMYDDVVIRHASELADTNFKLL